MNPCNNHTQLTATKSPVIEAKFYGWMPFLTPTLFKISTVKSCQGYYYQGYLCTIHVCKQTSFFLRATVQRLYRPLPGPWKNFFETGAAQEGSYPGIV